MKKIKQVHVDGEVLVPYEDFKAIRRQLYRARVTIKRMSEGNAYKARYIDREERKEHAKRLLAQGMKQMAVAYETGYSQPEISRIKRNMTVEDYQRLRAEKVAS